MTLIDVLTIFPEMFPAVLGASILGRAQAAGHLQVRVHHLRDYTHDRHRSVDDRPYGGGPGMVMRVEPIFEAVEAIRQGCGRPLGAKHPACGGKPGTVCETILLSPQGEPLSSPRAQQLAGAGHLIIICGHYEGVDERVREQLVTRSISIGDYILTGGELPAMVLIDCLARFIPDVIGHEQATEEESFVAGLLEYPQYTRPPVFREMAVPEVLLSGDHERVAAWRTQQSMARTKLLRPDLLNPAKPIVLRRSL